MGKTSVVRKTNAMGKRMANSVGVVGSASFWRNEATVQKRNKCRSPVSCLTRRVQSKGALHAGPCIFSCYLQERIVLAMECSPRQCRVANPGLRHTERATRAGHGVAGDELPRLYVAPHRSTQ